MEIEIAEEKILTYNDFLKLCCDTFYIENTALVIRIRKLPCTRVRNDDDVKRFQVFESFELVLNEP